MVRMPKGRTTKFKETSIIGLRRSHSTNKTTFNFADGSAARVDSRRVNNNLASGLPPGARAIVTWHSPDKRGRSRVRSIRAGGDVLYPHRLDVRAYERRLRTEYQGA
jgi:hypothetical protein